MKRKVVATKDGDGMGVQPPGTLGKVGKAKWVELAARLTAEDPLTLGVLETYCAAHERWVLAQRWLDDHGDVLELVSDKGVVLKVQPAPKLDVLARCEKAMEAARQVLVYRMK